ncbi:MAG: DUF1446 domain-containing protein [Rhodospirillales bacterium]|jgi:hypothetical protein|nr:DUF1446 domain-containing protein [Rhodospirillales bacterium]
MSEVVRIGGGAGYLDDRIEGAVELLKNGKLDYVMLDYLAERTLAILQEAKQAGGVGFAADLERRMLEILPPAAERGVKIVSNLGGADPAGAAAVVREVADSLDFKDLKIAVVEGDDVADLVQELDPVLAETGEPFSRLDKELTSANAYIGAFEMAAAIGAGADVVLAGRAADPALALAPLINAFGWSPEDLDRLALGTMAGHLIECAGQVTGGQFADGAAREVPDLDRLGFPIAEVGEDAIVITKAPGTGGRVDRHTVLSQLLYELGDPSAYITPDVTPDITAAQITELGSDRVRFEGVRGKPRPETLKVLCGVDNGYLAVSEIVYGGYNAVARARLSAEVLRKRLHRDRQLSNLPTRMDIVGVDSVYVAGPPMEDTRDVRLRVAVRAPDRETAARATRETEAMGINGPAGGGGKTHSIRHTVRTYACFIDREKITPAWRMVA